MNILCHSPIFPLSPSIARFALKPKDALAWLVAVRNRSGSGFKQLLASCPEALLFALFSNQSLTDSPTKRKELSIEALVSTIESVCSSPANNKSIHELEIKSSARKAFVERLRGVDASSIENELAEELNHELYQLNGNDGAALFSSDQLKSLPAPTSQAWQELAMCCQSAQSTSFDLTTWLTEEEDFEKRLQREKLASMKQLAYGASHEINNPLANIASRAQTLMMDETDPERKLRLAKINQQAFRAHEMIADMMLFAHPPAPEFNDFEMGDAIREVGKELQSAADQQSTALDLGSISSVGNTPVHADRTQICVALRALMMNALEALGEGGKVTVAMHPAEEHLEVVVIDDGQGISEAAQRHLFDPFYCGREAGRGLGFGLSKVWRIAELHGGEILAESPSDGGARFRLRIPYRSSMKSSA